MKGGERAFIPAETFFGSETELIRIFSENGGKIHEQRKWKNSCIEK